jgi:hypothetical protein
VKLQLERFEERTVPSFLSTNYAAGAGAASVATADFQGAGGVDFAVANINANTVSVFLNNNDGSGSFRAAATYQAGQRPVDIVAGDLNGDGLPDIVVTNVTTPGTVTILFNNPSNPGTFGAPVTVNTGGSRPLDVRLADLTGDGDLDIIAANYSSNTVSVLLNHGDGTFAAAQTYVGTLGTIGAYSLAVADFYGDGFPSVALGNFYAPNNGTVTILRGNGDGTLQPYTVVAHLPGFTSGLAAGDLGNGAIDLVSANNDASGVNVLLNDGSGNFTTTNYAISQPFPLRVTLGDVNGDGNLDVVTDNFGSTNIAILYGNGDGTLQPAQLVNSGGNQPSGVAIADVEGDSATDGLNDIIVSNFGSANVTVLIHSPAPIVLSTTLTGTFNNQTVSDGQIVFSDPIDPNTFTPDQFVLLDPSGNQVNVTGITPLDGTNTRFDVTFDAQSTLGTYMLTVGPNIFDPTDTYSMPAAFTSQFSITNNLLVNGGFETGTFSGWTQWGDTSFSGVSNGVPVHSGTYAAFFGPTGSLGGIMQTVSTTPGQTYTLILWLDHPFTGDTGTEYRVRIGGTTVDDQLNMANIPYTQFTYTYTATSTSTTIELGFLEPPAYFYLDDVVFTPNGPAPHGGSGGLHLLTSTVAGAGAPTLVQGQAASPLGGSGLGSFGLAGQQPSVPVQGQTAVPPATAAAATGLNGKLDPALVASAAPSGASSYHVPATNAVFSDPLLGNLISDTL